MVNLPKGLTLDLLETRWAGILNPVLANPATNMSFLSNVKLVSGTNVINHGLGQKQQGWIMTDILGAASVYRTQPFNDLTLTLFSSAPVTISLGVY